MADIFDEIDEDMKRDQMQVLWKRYGKLVVAAAVGVVLVVGARQGFNAWQVSQSDLSATAYREALKSDDVIYALEARRNEFTDGYAMLAQFQIAAERASINDFEAAEATYLALAEDPSVDPLYQQAATLLSVMVASKDVDISLLTSRLATLETGDGPWQAMALETGAGLALRAGDSKSALTKYKKLAELPGIPAGMRQRAERMSAMLSN